MKSCENTSPGPDGITYNHLKLIDNSAIALTPLYNCCLKFKAVPSSSKNTTTILIYKKGNRSDPGNWRPIALGNTIYKLYASCLNKRLYTWLDNCKILSPCQKGFLPHDGVFENNYVLDNIMRKFKVKKKICSSPLLMFLTPSAPSPTGVYLRHFVMRVRGRNLYKSSKMCIERRRQV